MCGVCVCGVKWVAQVRCVVRRVASSRHSIKYIDITFRTTLNS